MAPLLGSFVQIKSLPVTIEKAASSAYDASFVMSAATADRVKDTIDPAAYKSALGSKLIALYQHDPDRPIGFWENLRMAGDTLVGDLKVAGTNLGQMIKQLIADGVPLGASIGFRGKGEQNKAGGVHFKELELLECSVVSIPAHPRAQILAKQVNIDLQSSEVDEYADDSGRTFEDVQSKAQRAVLAANRSLRIKS